MSEKSLPKRLVPLAAFVLGWTALCLTGLVLGTFGVLGNRGLYAATLAVSCFLLVFWFARLARAHPPVNSVSLGRWCPLDAALLVPLAAGAVGAITIAASYAPNNWDSCAYRLPRAFFYLAQGNLLHFESGFDARLIYYPYNSTFFYLPLAHVGAGSRAYNAVPLICWAVTAVAVYAVCAEIRCSRPLALLTASVLALAPAVYVQSTSGNDDILAASAFAAAAAFVPRAWSGCRLSQTVALLGAALGIGCRITWIFFWPALVALVLGTLLIPRSRKWLRSLQVPLLASILAIPLATAFIWCNLLSAGSAGEPALAYEVMNRPFRPGVGLQTLKLQTAQVLAADFPALLPARIAEQTHAVERFNAATRPLLGTVRQGFPFTHPNYEFRGIADPAAVQYFEQTLWLGLWPAATLVLLLTSDASDRRFWAGAALIAAFWAWHFGYSLTMRYAETVGVYYTTAAALSMAGFALLVQQSWNRGGLRRWIAGLVCAAVLGANAMIGANQLLYSSRRNLPSILKPGFDGVTWHYSPELRALLASAPSVHLIITHWECLLWNFIQMNPRASYTVAMTPSDAASVNLLNLESWLSSDPHIPADLPDSGSRRWIYSGSGAEDSTFASGPSVDARSPGSHSYALLPCRVRRVEGEIEVRCGAPTAFPMKPPATAGSVRVRIACAEPASRESIEDSIASLSRNTLAVRFGACRSLLVEAARGGVSRSTRLSLDGPRYTIVPLVQPAKSVSGDLLAPQSGAVHAGSSGGSGFMPAAASPGAD